MHGNQLRIPVKRPFFFILIDSPIVGIQVRRLRFGESLMQIYKTEENSSRCVGLITKHLRSMSTDDHLRVKINKPLKMKKNESFIGGEKTSTIFFSSQQIVWVFFTRK